MSVYALRLDNGIDTAARVRMAHLLALPVGPAPLTAFSGLRADGGGVVAVAAGSMNVTVSPFVAWVQGGVGVTQGGYPFVCDAQVTLTLAAGHASLSRTDTVAGVVRDNAADGSTFTDARVVVIQGTPGAGAPALPKNCVPLRDVVVPANTSAGTGGLSSGMLGTDRRAYLTAQPDAGWVDVPASSLFGWGGSLSYARRAGIVTVALGVTIGAYHPGDGIWTMPDGFRPTRRVVSAAVYGDSVRSFEVSANTGAVIASGQSGSLLGGGIYGTVSYPVF